MFFRKKKNKYTPPADSKYKLGEYVHFRYRDELFFGYVFYIYKDANNNTKRAKRRPAIYHKRIINLIYYSIIKQLLYLFFLIA